MNPSRVYAILINPSRVYEKENQGQGLIILRFFFTVYEDKLKIKRIERQQKQLQYIMSSNLSTQLLIKGIQPLEIFTGTDDQDPITWIQTIDELFDATKVDTNDR
jgi:hypothetical protein